MPRATDRFITEIRRSHTVVSYVDVISSSQEVRRLVAVDGEVTVDRTAQFRRSGRVACIDPTGDFTPDEAGALLTPYGSEVRPYRGVRYSDGTVELYPLGVFRISKSTISEASSHGGGAGVRIALEMFDRSRTISRAKFTSVYTIPPGTNALDAIKLLVARSFPDAEYDAISTTVTTTAPKIYAAGDDPWEAIVEFAKSMGCEVYFDVDGRVVVAPPVDIDALPTPDFSYIEGNGCTMTDLQKVYADEPGHNGVVVTSESPGDEKPPVRAEAWDMEPSSPTYRYGPYREVPKFETDNNVKTVAEAQAMADSLLRGMLGVPSQLSITSWVNPALEAGDVVEVRRKKMHVDGLYAVDAFNIPLRKDGTQALTLRQKRRVQ